MAETIVLDPAAVATGRTQLDITAWVDADPGVDWGDADIAAYMADQQVGSSPVDYRIPNRQIKIPLNLRSLGTVTYSQIRLSVQQKVALFQREGGQIMRQIDSTPLYADVVNATLHLGGSILAAYRSIDVDAVLSLECVPDWYGAEITLDSASATGVMFGKLKQSAADAVIAGNHPGRCRIIVTDTSSSAQHGLLWGYRAQYYSGATTASLFYEAEALAPLNGGLQTAVSGASGGSAVQLSSPPANTWVPTLWTHLATVDDLTHQGTYRVWMRAHSPNDRPQFRLLWGAGGMAVPATNDAVQLPGSNAFYLLDLGQIRIDAPPVGPNYWQGVIQTYTTASAGTANLDALYFQPLDETAGKLAYTDIPPASSLQTTVPNPGTGADDASTGTLAWSNPTNIQTGAAASIAFSTSSAATHYLKATNFGFAIPAGATIAGIQVRISRKVVQSPTGYGWDARVSLVQAGTVQATNRAIGSFYSSAYATDLYGGDLWGGAWAYTDINNSGFGVVLSSVVQGNGTLSVNGIGVTVFYTLAGGFTIAQDAVVYGNNTTEIRTEGPYRANVAGWYAPVSRVVGDLPRIPPSRLETRPIELFVKPTRGNLTAGTAALPDAGLDGFHVQVKYRPSYLFVGA